MIDTSTSVFYDKAIRSGVRYETNEPAKVNAFQKYIYKGAGDPPAYDGHKYEEFSKKHNDWLAKRESIIAHSLSKTNEFNTLLREAITEVMEKGGSDDDFEDLVEKYYSKKAALELKRNRIVVGGCSQDMSPRVHALNIARLSAESISWETFLRAHLDIMNDRFERMSDGSYAWKDRKTYIKELEVLDINVTDLLLGISLRISNAPGNHYYGNISRLGRALSESKDASETENKMLAIIADDSLDNYNRIRIYFLFQHYNHNLSDKIRQQENSDRLNKASKTLAAM
jgi:hypothetical protein